MKRNVVGIAAMAVLFAWPALTQTTHPETDSGTDGGLGCETKVTIYGSFAKS